MAESFDRSDHRAVLMRLKQPSFRLDVYLDTLGLRLPGSPAARGTLPDACFREADLLMRRPRWAETNPCELQITTSLLTAVFPRLPAKRAAAFTAPLNLYLVRYEIDSVCRIAAFFGQIGVESGGMTRLEENLNYTTEHAIAAAFSERLIDADERADFLGKPESLANRVYADRLGNGDEASGDGWRYKGRGLIQLTGHDNYAAFGDDVSMDLTARPESLAEPSMAVMSACWFWKKHGLNALADRGDFTRLTAKINAKRLDQAKRMTTMWRARRCLLAEMWKL